jgi:class 3 adenylate cyclase
MSSRDDVGARLLNAGTTRRNLSGTRSPFVLTLRRRSRRSTIGAVEIPDVQYAEAADGVHIAYQVVGEGPVDLVFVPGAWSNLTWNWQLPSYAHFLRRLSSFCRLIVVDRRGSGLSDRLSPNDLPALETLADDFGVVLDAAGSERASLLGVWSGGQTCAVFAATRPERVDRLILYAMNPGGEQSWGKTWDREGYLARVAEGWGTRSFARWDPAWGLSVMAPSVSDDHRTLDWYVASLQFASGPGSAAALAAIYAETDVQPVLPSIRVPTLVLGRQGDRLEPITTARYIAGLIPGARLLELFGEDDLWFVGDIDSLVDAIQEFVTGVRPALGSDRMLATILFTDIVGSTRKAAELGDSRWKVLLADHNDRIRDELDRFRGREIDTAGDGFFATFDGPARAVRCAQAIGQAVRPLDLQIRAGCHTGEIELSGGDVRGIAVHIGARVAELAGPNEVLVSSTVKDLVAGSGLVFQDLGEHELKGIPDRWHLYRVESVPA